MKDHQERLRQVSQDLADVTEAAGANSGWLWALGRVVAQYASLQTVAFLFLWHLVDPEDEAVGMIASAEMSDGARRDLLCSLARHRLSRAGRVTDWETRLEVVRVAMTQAEQDRNRVVHGMFLWREDEARDGPPTMRVKVSARSKRGLDFQAESCEAAELAALSAEIGRVHELLNDFISTEFPEARTDREWRTVDIPRRNST
jgi:hypothetical protein